jgi:hypothetical protein
MKPPQVAADIPVRRCIVQTYLAQLWNPGILTRLPERQQARIRSRKRESVREQNATDCRRYPICRAGALLR